MADTQACKDKQPVRMKSWNAASSKPGPWKGRLHYGGEEVPQQIFPPMQGSTGYISAPGPN